MQLFEFRQARTTRALRTLGLVFSLCVPLQSGAANPKAKCYRTYVEGEVNAEHGFDMVFAKGLRFLLEPLKSGWIVRVLDADAPRGPHDYAELATPPYQSVNPLLISTDWAFRAQDAVAWNPRPFRYAADRKTFTTLGQLQPSALAGDPEAEGRLTTIVSAQPEAELQLLNARFAPGVANQVKMASAVALQLGNTPHEADTAAAPSPLGKLESIRFRVVFQLPTGMHAASGLPEQIAPCEPEPTTAPNRASQNTHTKLKR